MFLAIKLGKEIVPRISKILDNWFGSDFDSYRRRDCFFRVIRIRRYHFGAGIRGHSSRRFVL
jgi:hypothetical protein